VKFGKYIAQKNSFLTLLLLMAICMDQYRVEGLGKIGNIKGQKNLEWDFLISVWNAF
jgi:hypothetical protein